MTVKRKRIQEIIRDQHVKREWLAFELGVDRSTLRRWLSGEIQCPDRMKLQHLARALGVSERELFVAN